jgi:hypothetical protein
MKPIKAFVVVILGLQFCLSSCKSEIRKLFNSVEGNWQIQRVEFREAANDSIANPAGMTIGFQSCRWSENNSGPSNCLAQIAWNGQTYQMFYQMVRGATGNQISLRPVPAEYSKPDYEAIAERFDGSYRIRVLDDNRLELIESQNCENFPNSPGCDETIIIATR